jgi:hypothetical protein
MHRRTCTLILWMAVAAAGCSGDEDGAPRDAGTDATAGSSGSSPRPGGSGGTGCRCSACNDSCSDRYNCFPYPLEAFPWPEGIADGMARRAPLNLLCYDECDPSETLGRFEARLRCGDMDDGGVVDADDRDSGVPSGLWRRSEGCGSVQFSTLSPAEPRFYNFDRDTGELIGFAGLERFSIIGRGGGFGCAAPAWVAGEVRTDCPTETVTTCEPR